MEEFPMECRFVSSVIKPTPSIYKQQDTIDKETHEPVKLQIQEDMISYHTSCACCN